MSEAAPDTVEYLPAAHASHADWLVAPGKPEYVPGGQALQAEADLAPTTDDHVPGEQDVYSFKPSAPQNAPAGQSRQLLLLSAPVVG